jgi:hypothetical protein
MVSNVQDQGRSLPNGNGAQASVTVSTEKDTVSANPAQPDRSAADGDLSASEAFCEDAIFENYKSYLGNSQRMPFCGKGVTPVRCAKKARHPRFGQKSPANLGRSARNRLARLRID